MNANTQPHALVIDNLVIPVRIDPEHEYTVSNQEAADGYGVSRKTLDGHRRNHARELKPGKHFFTEVNTGAQNLSPGQNGQRHGNPVITRWTKRGLIRLGFFIKSERAERFRDMAEDLIIRELESAAEPDPFDPKRVLDGLIANLKITCKRHVGALEEMIRMRCRLEAGEDFGQIPMKGVSEKVLVWLRHFGEMQLASRAMNRRYTVHDLVAGGAPVSPATLGRSLSALAGQAIKIDAGNFLVVVPARNRHSRGWEFRIERNTGLQVVR